MSASNQQPGAPPAAGTPLVDLAAGVVAGALVVSAESREDPADRTHRHAQESADATFRRWKDGIRFGLSALLLTGVTSLSAKFAV